MSGFVLGTASIALSFCFRFLSEDPSPPPLRGGRGKGAAGEAGTPRVSRRTLAAAVATAAVLLRSSLTFSEFDRCTCKRGGAQPAEKRGVRHRCEDRRAFTELDQRESIRADAAELDGVGKLDPIAR